MRNAFIDELVAQAELNDKIALIVGDLGYSVVEPFADKFPTRFINAGVAEQNMMGLAAGMASEGYHVFVYSIANFPTFRCAEQIRNDVAYHNLPVTVVAVGGGLGYGNLGYSHHAIQDYGLMRMMPNMLIAAPGDPMEVRGCIQYLVSNPQPSYLRLGKAGEPCFHETIPELKPGKWLMLDRNVDSKKIILTTGATLETAVKLQNNSAYQNYSIGSLPLWGMEVKGLQINQAMEYEAVLTVEDHLVDCGFGSWLNESFLGAQVKAPKLEIRALNPNICGLVGSQKELNILGGL